MSYQLFWQLAACWKHFGWSRSADKFHIVRTCVWNLNFVIKFLITLLLRPWKIKYWNKVQHHEWMLKKVYRLDHPISTSLATTFGVLRITILLWTICHWIIWHTVRLQEKYGTRCSAICINSWLGIIFISIGFGIWSSFYDYGAFW